MSHNGGQLNLSCGFTPSAAYARAQAPAAAPRARQAAAWSDSYVRTHDTPPRPTHASYADVLAAAVVARRRAGQPEPSDLLVRPFDPRALVVRGVCGPYPAWKVR